MRFGDTACEPCGKKHCQSACLQDEDYMEAHHTLAVSFGAFRFDLDRARAEVVLKPRVACLNRGRNEQRRQWLALLVHICIPKFDAWNTSE